MTPENWPLVDPNDDGIRPAGRPDECFYCHQKIGTPHKEDCIVVTKLVTVRYTLELEIEVPWSWDSGDVEFHRNDGTWCAENAIKDLQRHVEHRDANAGGSAVPCLCNGFQCEFVDVADPTPRRAIRIPK